MRIGEIIMQTLSYKNEISEKRATRMTVVLTMLILTSLDVFLYSRTLRMEVLATWLAFAGYDGYRITQEKKNEAPPPP